MLVGMSMMSPIKIGMWCTEDRLDIVESYHKLC